MFLVILTELENAEHPKLSVMVTVYVPPEVIYIFFVLLPFDQMKVLPYEADNNTESPIQNAVPDAFTVGLVAVLTVIPRANEVALQPLPSVIVTV